MAVQECMRLDQCNALKDAQDMINQLGTDIVLETTNEQNVERDIYNSIKKRTVVNYTFKTFPVNYSPTQDKLEKAGIRENVDVIVFLSAKDFSDNNIDYNDIDGTRWEVLLNGETYTIGDKNRINMFSDVYLNFVLGLFKK